MTALTFHRMTTGHNQGSFFKTVKDGILRKLAAMQVEYRQEQAVRQAIRELENCDDRELADLGISRFNIAEAVRKGL